MDIRIAEKNIWTCYEDVFVKFVEILSKEKIGEVDVANR